ncbi:MAG: hypothetical protein V4469_02180 [Patescibacteria group bacterium]
MKLDNKRSPSVVYYISLIVSIIVFLIIPNGDVFRKILVSAGPGTICFVFLSLFRSSRVVATTSESSSIVKFSEDGEVMVGDSDKKLIDKIETGNRRKKIFFLFLPLTILFCSALELFSCNYFKMFDYTGAGFNCLGSGMVFVFVLFTCVPIILLYLISRRI